MLSDLFIELFKEFVKSYDVNGQGTYISSKDKHYDQTKRDLAQLQSTIETKRYELVDYDILYTLATSAILSVNTSSFFFSELKKFFSQYHQKDPTVLPSLITNIKKHSTPSQVSLLNVLLGVRLEQEETHLAEIETLTEQMHKLEEQNKHLHSELLSIKKEEKKAYIAELQTLKTHLRAREDENKLLSGELSAARSKEQEAHDIETQLLNKIKALQEQNLSLTTSFEMNMMQFNQEIERLEKLVSEKNALLAQTQGLMSQISSSLTNTAHLAPTPLPTPMVPSVTVNEIIPQLPQTRTPPQRVVSVPQKTSEVPKPPSVAPKANTTIHRIFINAEDLEKQRKIIATRAEERKKAQALKTAESETKKKSPASNLTLQ